MDDQNHFLATQFAQKVRADFDTFIGADYDEIGAMVGRLLSASETERAAWLEYAIPESARSKMEWDTLKRLARDLRPLPGPLAEWHTDPPPRPRKGPRHSTRDHLICETIHSILANGLLPAMRAHALGRKAGAGRSACDVAGAAWGLTYPAAEKVWLRGRDGFRGQPAIRLRYG